MRAPDLQRLVQRFGGYWSVPPDVWKAYRKAVAQWEQEVRSGSRYQRTAAGALRRETGKGQAERR